MPRDSTKAAKTATAKTTETAATTTDKKTAIAVKPANLKQLRVRIRGTAPLVICKFSTKARTEMREKQQAGSTANARRKRDPKDFEALYQDSRHISVDGRDGIPAAAFRAGMISACRLVGLKQTIAKLSLFVVPDSFDNVEQTGLVHITKGEPRIFESIGRNATGGPDIRVRPQWKAGWEACPVIRWDADQLTAADVVNLLARVGLQVGVGEGRPDSRDSAGQGWGTFEIVQDEASE